MLEPIINLGGDNRKKLNCLTELLGGTAEGSKGIAELETMLDLLEGLDIQSEVEIDQSLARGLNYYTGAIIEVKAKGVSIGSVCGGGRYDNLTGVFGLPDVSGVGVSFGADRIYDVLRELELFPPQVQATSKIMLVNFGEKEAVYALKVLEELQKTGVSAELYPDTAKMKKQMKYADQKGIRYVLLIGEEEMKSGLLTLKDMESGEQKKIELEKLKVVLGGV